MRFLILFLFFFTLSLKASSMQTLKRSSHYVLKRSLSLEEAEKKAGIIFQGKFLESKITKSSSLQTREMKFKVEKVIKGLDPNSKEIIIKEWASIKNNLLSRDDKYESFIFYFYSPSEIGFSSMIKMTNLLE